MVLILFDFDGVLADTLGDMIQFAQETCDELGIDHTVTQDDLSGLEIMSFATYGRQCQVPENLIDEFVRLCTGKFAKKESPPAIFDELGDVIRELSIKHAIGIVSGNTTGNIKAFLVGHGLDGYVRAIYGVDESGSKAEKISRARSQLARVGETAFMVGDSVSDIRAAKESGATSIAVSWGHQSAEMLSDANPDHFVHTARELFDVISCSNFI